MDNDSMVTHLRDGAFNCENSIRFSYPPQQLLYPNVNLHPVSSILTHIYVKSLEECVLPAAAALVMQKIIMCWNYSFVACCFWIKQSEEQQYWVFKKGIIAALCCRGKLHDLPFCDCTHTQQTVFYLRSKRDRQTKELLHLCCLFASDLAHSYTA